MSRQHISLHASAARRSVFLYATLDLEGKYTLANEICQVIEQKCAWASCSDSDGAHCYGIDPDEGFRVGSEVDARRFSCSNGDYCAIFVDYYAWSNIGTLYVVYLSNQPHLLTEC
jgi:hypothetical protein